MLLLAIRIMQRSRQILDTQIHHRYTPILPQILEDVMGCKGGARLGIQGMHRRKSSASLEKVG